MRGWNVLAEYLLQTTQLRVTVATVLARDGAQKRRRASAASVLEEGCDNSEMRITRRKSATRFT